MHVPFPDAISRASKEKLNRVFFLALFITYARVCSRRSDKPKRAQRLFQLQPKRWLKAVAN